MSGETTRTTGCRAEKARERCRGIASDIRNAKSERRDAGSPAAEHGWFRGLCRRRSLGGARHFSGCPANWMILCLHPFHSAEITMSQRVMRTVIMLFDSSRFERCSWARLAWVRAEN